MSRDNSNVQLFGYGSYKPKYIQHLINNAKAFLVFLTFANFVQGIMINGLLKVNVTSIEKRFNLQSYESGFIISSYDIAGCLSLLPISYIGGKGHKPRWIGVGMIVSSVGMMTLALPHFLSGRYTYSTSTSLNSNFSSCVSNLVSNQTNIVFEECRENNDTSGRFVSLNRMKYIFVFGQFLIGAGSTPLASLSLTFIDDSVDPAVYPLYIGIYYFGALVGPAIGFILGSYFLKIFTEVDVRPEDITIESPQWVGAWWIGFVFCSLATFVLSLPILGYPSVLPSTLTRKETINDFTSNMNAKPSEKVEMKTLLKKNTVLPSAVEYSEAACKNTIGDKMTSVVVSDQTISRQTFEEANVLSASVISHQGNEETKLLNAASFADKQAEMLPKSNASAASASESCNPLPPLSVVSTQSSIQMKTDVGALLRSGEGTDSQKCEFRALNSEESVTKSSVAGTITESDLPTSFNQASNSKQVMSPHTDKTSILPSAGNASPTNILKQRKGAPISVKSSLTNTSGKTLNSTSSKGDKSVKKNDFVTTKKRLTEFSSIVIVQSFFRDLWFIVSNKAFIFLSMSAAVLGTVVSGFTTFGAKFFESQFQKSASDAANTFGYIFIPAGGVGLVLGAVLMSGLKLRHSRALEMCFAVSVLGLLLQLTLALYCPDVEFAGINVPYENETEISGTAPKSLGGNCNSQCSCLFNHYDPVCGDNGVTYYSSCFAGCTSLVNKPNVTYLNCSCIVKPPSSNAATSSPSDAMDFGSAITGACSKPCPHYTIILASLFIVVVTTFMCAIPGSDLSLRLFHKEYRSLSVGVQWILIRTTGTIPGPIIFGSMIDSTCLLWNKIDPCSDGFGSCVLYNNFELALTMLILSMIFKGASVLCFGFSWATYVPAALSQDIVIESGEQEERQQENRNPAKQ